MCHGAFDSALVDNDLGFALGRREIEIQSNEPLPRARLQTFRDMLVAWIIRNYQLKARCRFYQLPRLVDRQYTPVICKRVNHHNRVGTCFDDFIEITDRAGANGTRERTILPHGAVVPYQETSDEICSG